MRVLYPLLLFVTGGRSMIYEEMSKRNIAKSTLVSTEQNVPSKLACVQKCLRQRLDAVYEGTTCKCIEVEQHTTKEFEKSEEENGNYYSYAGQPHKLKYEKPKGQREEKITIQATQRAIKRGYLSKIIPRLTKQFKLTFDFVPTRNYEKSTYNIINLGNEYYHITSFGYQRKSFNILRRNKGQHPRSWYNIKIFSEDHPPPGSWFSVKITQLIEADGSYTYRVHFNDNLVLGIKNMSPQEYTNVQAYISGQQYKPFPGNIRNVYIYLKEENEIST